MMNPLLLILLTLSFLMSSVAAIDLNIYSFASLQNATALISSGLMDYYVGNTLGGTIGEFSYPYYWWHAGAAWGSLLDYSYYFDNDTYVPTIKQSLLYQVGANWDYIPANQSTTEGNDDQAMWGITVMAAAEKNFSNPNSDEPGWLYLAQAVFNTMASRWDNQTCGGGLRWQIFRWNNGYDYKNTISNGALFHIGARLGRYTGNDSYIEWAEKIWDWLTEVEFVSINNGWWSIYDGAAVTNDCKAISTLQWTYNMGLVASGAAYIYNYTGNATWLERTENLVNSSAVFFQNNIMYEAACQPANTCDQDQRCFKSIFARCLGLTALMAPSTNATIFKWLETSAQKAAQTCDGGTDGHTCSLNWFNNTWDGKWGLGEQMNALEVIQNLLIWTKPGPLKASTGGTSSGNSAAGEINLYQNETNPLHITGGDEAGAAIITIVVGVSIIACGVWLVL